MKSKRTAGKSVRGVRDSEYRQLADFRYAIRTFLEFSEQAARNAGITPQQHQALLAIRGMTEESGANLGFIAERLRVRHHSAVELVNRLAAAKLVERNEDPEDRRRVVVTLTPKAEKILQSLSATHIEELRRLKPALAAVLALADETGR
ncbi:MAG TPA: MarR family transcriptional regulator [Steroidobacteraceae bacterium]|nr:MarR family transcriptional regulator [Steroidobacteraceae bacterium]